MRLVVFLMLIPLINAFSISQYYDCNNSMLYILAVNETYQPINITIRTESSKINIEGTGSINASNQSSLFIEEYNTTIPVIKECATFIEPPTIDRGCVNISQKLDKFFVVVYNKTTEVFKPSNGSIIVNKTGMGYFIPMPGHGIKNYSSTYYGVCYDKIAVQIYAQPIATVGERIFIKVIKSDEVIPTEIKVMHKNSTITLLPDEEGIVSFVPYEEGIFSYDTKYRETNVIATVVLARNESGFVGQIDKRVNVSACIVDVCIKVKGNVVLKIPITAIDYSGIKKSIGLRGVIVNSMLSSLEKHLQYVIVVILIMSVLWFFMKENIKVTFMGTALKGQHVAIKAINTKTLKPAKKSFNLIVNGMFRKTLRTNEFGRASFVLDEIGVYEIERFEHIYLKFRVRR